MIVPRTPALVLVALLASATACRPAQKKEVPAGSPSNTLTGTVAETMNSGGYTYARLQVSGKEDAWIAATEFPVKTGDRLTAAIEMPMENFESKTLKRTFPVIYFVSSVERDGQVVVGQRGGGAAAMMPSHGASAPGTPSVERIDPPAGGLAIAEVWAKRASLAGKQVTVSGKVVKVNSAIMNRNWIHLQDGSGSATDHTNDLTVTTNADVKVGDVVTVTGVLATGKDFGAGYAYDAILEDARIVK